MDEAPQKIKRKLGLVQEALSDYHKGELSDLACLIAIQLVVNPQPEPPKKILKKWKKLLKNI